MQDINAWLKSNQDYNTGFALYKKYGPSDFLKKLFADGPTPFNKPKLAAELLKLAPTPPAKSKIPEIPIIPDSELSESKEELSEFHQNKISTENQVRYLAIKESISSLYRQMERNMSVLNIHIDETVLHQTAKQILKLHSKIRENWSIIDYFEEKGTFPDEHIKKPPITNSMQLLHVSIWKAKKRLANPNCRNRENTLKLLAEKELQLKKLQHELKGKAINE